MGKEGREEGESREYVSASMTKCIGEREEAEEVVEVVPASRRSASRRFPSPPRCPARESTVDACGTCPYSEENKREGIVEENA